MFRIYSRFIDYGYGSSILRWMIPIRIQGFWKIYSWKNVSYFLSSKIAIYLSLCLRTSVLQEKPSVLKREHLALQYMKFPNFFFYFCKSFVLLDPDPVRDPLTWLNPGPIRIRIRKTEKNMLSSVALLRGLVLHTVTVHNHAICIRNTTAW
jgi:hypothetical protein